MACAALFYPLHPLFYLCDLSGYCAAFAEVVVIPGRFHEKCLREISPEESARRSMQATPLGVVEAEQRSNFPGEIFYRVFLIKRPCQEGGFLLQNKIFLAFEALPSYDFWLQVIRQIKEGLCLRRHMQHIPISRIL